LKIDIHTTEIVIMSILFSCIALFLLYIADYKEEEKIEKKIIFSITLLGLLIRLFLAPTTNGHTTDVLCFTYWADFAASKGIANFYTSGIFVDYPPTYIYILYIIGKLQHFFNVEINSKIMLFMIKVPSIAADIVLGYLIYKLGKKRLKGMMPVVLCFLYIFNPAVIINSSVWAQIDGFYTLFIVIMLYCIYKEKIEISAVVYTISVLIKPQTFIFTPILILMFIENKSVTKLIKGAVYSFIAALVIIVPFTGSQKPLWIVEKLKATLASYPYASINAFNLFALSGGNWELNNKGFMFLNYKSWGMIFIVLISLFSIYIYFKSTERHRVFYIAYFITCAVFVLSSKMHERYLFPALAISLILYVYSKDRRVLYSFIGFSITHYINVAYVLMCNGKDLNFIPNGSLWINVIAIANIALLFSVIGIGISMYCKESLVSSISRICGIGKRDCYILLSISFLYFIIAVINLGSVKVPESYWAPSEKSDYVIADMGEVRDLDRLYYFPGLGGGKYKVYLSIDKNTWSEAGDFNGDSIFVWNYINITNRARYIMISTTESGGTVYEIGIYEKGNKTPVNVKEENNSNLFNEQHTVKYTPSYLHGMYFDEIYHARTAFEHLNKINPYEWTHPPLGKIFISMGIFLFGMNPFGWRIVGTLIGVIMIPIMYFFGLKIFGKTKYAFIAAFLMAFDFMHFTQTRIATIDVYAVLFVLLMYYFMYRFISSDYYNKDNSSSIKYFALSGITFGMGAASKWSCLYGGVGLALILLLYILYEYKEFKKSYRGLESEAIDNNNFYERDKYCVEYFKRRTVKIILYGFIFFIIVPGIIYSLSYIPYMLVPGSKGIEDILTYQKRMYDYHSNLVATHPFSSAWWEWPIIRKPIWYYTGQAYLPSDKVSSIVSMGNPAIWWIGIAAIIGTAVITIKKKDKRGLFILISAASQYVPWIFVPRLIFIYHYFATIPFIILSIVYVFEWIVLKYKRGWMYIGIYLCIVVVLFIVFYPVMSGLVVDKIYVEKFLRWFQSWYFYS
jgi:dolichyl-phosphate-mannose-protein mannosyltransferase